MAEQKINIALESSVEDVKTSIGATGNTGGSTTAGSIFGKLNKIIADLASHISSWTSTRAGYIDTIKTNTDRLTSARATIIDNIGATGNTGGTASAGTVMAKLNALITNTTANNTASKTGVLSAKLAYVISLLENSTYGLSAIKSNGVPVNSLSGKIVKSIQTGTISAGTSGVTTATATINAVDITKTVVLYGGSGTSSARDYDSGCYGYMRLINSTTIEYNTVGTSPYGSIAAYTVLEFY